MLLWRRLVLLRFGAPRFHSEPGLGRVTLPIRGGLLVARAGRGRGLLRFELRPDQGATRLRAVVDGYVPRLCGSGPLLRFRCWIYSRTQLRLHVRVTGGFLRSLSRGELPPPRVERETA